jgi:hypothetical protein
MAYRRPAPRSPPKNFKVSFIEEPPLSNEQQNFIDKTVPKLAKTFTTA